MEIIRICDAVSQRAACVVALGFFDGLHIGHRALLEKAVAEAKARGVAAAVFTFADSLVFKRGKRLCDEERRFALFEEAGIERVYLADFPSLAPLSPEAFVSEVLIEKVFAVAAVCGFNYRFGARAAGDAACLASLLAPYGVPLFTVPECKIGDVTVSTTAIKCALQEGRAEDAAAMLGRPYSHAGIVTHGKALGRKIGVPTANIPFGERIFTPKRGVWIVRCDVEGMNEGVCGVANVGVRPTVDAAGEENCEVHFLSPMPALYGKRVCVHFLKIIRAEEAFPDLSALSERISLDKEIAKEFFSTWNGQS